MSFPVFEQCTRSLSQAQEVLRLLRQRQAVTAETVRALQRRRRTADVAMQATFDELRRAFITPIDREDALLLRQRCEQVTHAAEETVLQLYRSGSSALTPDDTALLSAVCAECDALHAAVSALSAFPRNEAVLQHLNHAEQRHRTSEETNGSTALHAFSAACRSTCEAVRYVLLRMA